MLKKKKQKQIKNLQLPVGTSRTRQFRRGKRCSSQSASRDITCEDGDITAGGVCDGDVVFAVEGDEGEVTRAQTTGGGQADEGQGSVAVDAPGGHRVGWRVGEGFVEAVRHVKVFIVGLWLG